MARRRAAFVLFGLVVAVAAGAMPARALSAPEPESSYIVVFHDGADGNAETARLERSRGFKATRRYTSALDGFAARLTPSQVARLAADPDVAFVTRDQVVRTTDVPIAAGETAPSGVRRIEAANTIDARSASTVNVAVIDTGVDLDHPDLDVSPGKNCVNGSVAPDDDNGHGTHVAGTIAARNAGSGVIGVAPGTRVYAVKVLNASGSGTWSQVICGIDWVTANASALNIGVVNMSLSGGGSNDNACGSINGDALHAAICRSTAAGVSYVVAAGNSAASAAASAPASYPEVLTVTAVSDSDGAPGGVGGAPTCRTGELDDRYATFSNYVVNQTEINHTIAGPGVCTYSTWPGGGYNTISGTSMASPHVAGAVALCLGENDAAGPCAGLTPAQVIQKVRADAAAVGAANDFTGDPNTPVAGRHYGHLVWVGLTGAPPAPPPDPTAPAAPVLSGTAGNGTVSLTWTTPDDGGAPITGYDLYRNGSLRANVGVVNTFGDTGLINGTAYTYAVVAMNEVGPSGSSNAVVLTPQAPPAAPTNLVATALTTSTAIRLTWSHLGGAGVTFQIQRSRNQSSWTTIGTTSSTSITNSGLSRNTRYYYRVRATNAVGNSGWSTIASARTRR